MIKSELRKMFLVKRQMLTATEREAASAKIAASFFSYFDLTKLHFLHCFIPSERFGEVDTRPIFQRIWNEFSHIQTVVPRVDHETEELDSLKYGPDDELVPNRWKIGEPAHNVHIEPENIDMVIVPLLCFDRRGHRVGYGKGYYDRFLSRCRADCTKVGLSFFAPVDNITDAYDKDVTLDLAVTPTDVMTFSG